MFWISRSTKFDLECIVSGLCSGEEARPQYLSAFGLRRWLVHWFVGLFEGIAWRRRAGGRGGNSGRGHPAASGSCRVGAGKPSRICR